MGGHSGAVRAFEEALSRNERSVVRSLNSPAAIQNLLDQVRYGDADRYRSPVQVLREGTACCFDGALLAAAILRRLGYTPRIVEMVAVRDDDHIIALYTYKGCYGAVAKSNYAGLRFREPVYRTLRELVMSYFECYYNLRSEKTLRAYTVPLRLEQFDKFNWMVSDQHLGRIADRLDTIKQIALLTPHLIRCLSPVDERSYQAGMVGANLSAISLPSVRR